jgi:hypothetical protein
MTQLAQNLWPACVSSLVLDRIALGEPVPDDVRAHVQGCARCSAQLERMKPLEPLPSLRVVPLRPPRKRWLLSAGAAGLAAAAAVALVARQPAGERVKGSGQSLSMFVQHGAAVRQAGPHELVAAGDAVRFAVTSPVSSYVAVLSLDPRGRGSVYFPLGAVAQSVPAGADVALPLGTRLDESVGEERIVGLFCDKPVELEPIRAALEGGHVAAPEGCQVVRWSFEKK